MDIMRRFLRATPAFAVGVLLFTSPASAAVGGHSNDCDEFIAEITKTIDDNWDDAPELLDWLETWQQIIQSRFSHYAPRKLQTMSDAEIEAGMNELTMLKECAPKIKAQFDRFTRRIGELENLQNASFTLPRGRHPWQDRRDQLARLHADVVDMLADRVP
ncbi:MAG: hypothetical protein MJB57_15130 [Gemmatimonadetes bacterium]|nr:hypothetical protein [Gemmatimonadota bacterium]